MRVQVLADGRAGRRARRAGAALEPAGAAVRPRATNGGASTSSSTPGSCPPTAGSGRSGARSRRRRRSGLRPRRGTARRRRGRRATTTTHRPRQAASRAGARCSSTDFRALTEREHAARHRGADAPLRARTASRCGCAARRRARQGRRLDLPRHASARSVASGGTPFHLAWKDRRRVRPRLVLLIDVSRSMAAYSFFYLRLARALAAELPRRARATSSTPA